MKYPFDNFERCTDPYFNVMGFQYHTLERDESVAFRGGNCTAGTHFGQSPNEEDWQIEDETYQGFLDRAGEFA